jgi:hypothetical protein
VAGLADRKPLLERAVESLRARRDRELSRCAKACFLDKDGKTPTLEGERLLADLRKQCGAVRIERSSAIAWGDRPRRMLRIEARREIVLRLINLLELDPMEVARFVEVDDGRT